MDTGRGRRHRHVPADRPVAVGHAHTALIAPDVEIEPAEQHRGLGLRARVEVYLRGFLPGIELGRQGVQIRVEPLDAAGGKQATDLEAVPRQRDVDRKGIAAPVRPGLRPGAQAGGQVRRGRRLDFRMQGATGQALHTLDNARQQVGIESLGGNGVHGRGRLVWGWPLLCARSELSPKKPFGARHRTNTQTDTKKARSIMINR